MSKLKKTGISPAILRRKMRIKLLAAGGLLLTLAVGLILLAFQESIVFFHGPSDIMAGKVETDRNFRLGGLVAMDSVKRADQNGVIEFAIEDGVHTVAVQFQGLLPDLFREGQGVVALGSLNSNGQFIAQEVLAKHDETYMPAEAVEAMKRAGTWQGEQEGKGAQEGQGAQKEGAKK
ncbi:MAG: cytochrome c maturation protein CcmE [Alphaproteobacteria bacterium]